MGNNAGGGKGHQRLGFNETSQFEREKLINEKGGVKGDGRRGIDGGENKQAAIIR